jgi:hypothetical protein
LRFAIEHRQKPDNRNSEILNRNSFYHRVPPGERDLTSSDGDPGTNGVISKTRCGGLNKAWIEHFASPVDALLNQQFSLTPVFRPVGKVTRSKRLPKLTSGVTCLRAGVNENG